MKPVVSRGRSSRNGVFGVALVVCLGIDAANPPSIDSQPVDCTTLVPTGVAPSPLDSPGATGLTQNGTEFHINWKTSSAWAGSCRRVTLRVPAASNPVAFSASSKHLRSSPGTEA